MLQELIRQQYKVIQVLCAEEQYGAVLAVDILDRERPVRLLNLYGGSYRKSCVSAFYDLRGCHAYRELFLWEDQLVTVFSYRKGETMEQVFPEKAKLELAFRWTMTQKFLEEALKASLFPSQIGCALLLESNIQFFPKEAEVELAYMIRPLSGTDERQLVLSAKEQLRKILEVQWNTPLSQRRFVRSLAHEDASMAELYSRWKTTWPVMRREQELIQAKGMLSRWLHLLMLNGKDRWQRRKEGRG